MHDFPYIGPLWQRRLDPAGETFAREHGGEASIERAAFVVVKPCGEGMPRDRGDAERRRRDRVSSSLTFTYSQWIAVERVARQLDEVEGDRVEVRVEGQVGPNQRGEPVGRAFAVQPEGIDGHT